jgi:predicted RNA polymerase sigma factor
LTQNFLAIVQLLESKPIWEGTATELLAELESIAGERIAKSRAWVVAPNKLSNRLTRLAPDLRAKGITFYRPHRANKKGSRLLRLLDFGQTEEQNRLRV